MSHRFDRGLVVGKFSPLHRGHEFVIHQALAMCKEVVIISYSKPEFPGCETKRRKAWLQTLFPQARHLVVKDNEFGIVPENQAAARAHRDFVGFLCRDVLGLSIDAVFTSESYGDGFADHLSAFFQRPVKHFPVDPDRARVPVSGTILRSDIHGNSKWLSPAVYACFVERVCLLGGESSGKSTLAAMLGKRFETSHVPEYGRELWEDKEGRLEIDDMLLIAETQISLEEHAARAARRFLFCDTSPLTTLFYSLFLFGAADPKLLKLAERHYDWTVLCAPDFSFVQDGTRQTDGFREMQHRWYLRELNSRNIPYLSASGAIDNRILQITNAIRAM